MFKNKYSPFNYATLKLMEVENQVYFKIKLLTEEQLKKKMSTANFRIYKLFF